MSDQPLQESAPPVISLNGRRYIDPSHPGLYLTKPAVVVPLADAEKLAAVIEYAVECLREGDKKRCRPDTASQRLRGTLVDWRAAHPRVVSEKDYDDLGQQLDGAVEALEEIFDDLEDAPMSSYWPGAHHARQVAEMALERLRSRP